MMTYQEEINVMFKAVLNNSFFRHFSQNTTFNSEKAVGLELIITSDCNLNCSYCYLNKYKDQLYPKEFRDPELIKQNLNIFLDFFIKNDFFVDSLDIFSGEIWQTSFGISILNILLKKSKEHKFCNRIIIPSNMSFLLSASQTEKIEKLMEDFRSINVSLIWSGSIDGKIIEDKFRPFNDTKLKHTDEFYDNFFSFLSRHPETGMHPMISSDSCKYWIENYKWFKERLKQIGMEDREPMMLEVRNDDWTDEKIEDFKKFLSFLIQNQKELSSDKKDFCDRIFKYHNYSMSNCYIPYNLYRVRNQISCSLSNLLHVRLGDLTIVPCHRLAYDELILGKFVIENNKIVDVIGYNPELFLYIRTYNPQLNHLKCDTCSYQNLCIKGCLGMEYEQFRQINIPCESVCKLFKEKINFLIDTYEAEGLLDTLTEEAQTYPKLQDSLQEIRKVQFIRQENKGGKDDVE